MLDFIYWPVSWVISWWHSLFDHLLPNGPSGDGFAWTLAVVFFVFTVRLLLLKLVLIKARTDVLMIAIGPQLQAIRREHRDDRVEMTLKMQDLQRRYRFNPLLKFVHIPTNILIYAGAFHVLTSFNRTGSFMGQPGMTASETRSIPNYAFTVGDVNNFLDARLLGAPLQSFAIQPASQWKAFFEPGSPVSLSRLTIVFVAMAIALVAAIATYLRARESVARDPENAWNSEASRIRSNTALFGLPLFPIAFSLLLPVVLLVYWSANSCWTLRQEPWVIGRLPSELKRRAGERS